jgi:hypothetical protein
MRHLRSQHLSAIAVGIVVLLSTAITGLSQTQPRSSGTRNQTSRQSAKTDPTVVTNDDVMRALAQGDSPDSVSARIRRNRSHFTNIDRLIPEIRGKYDPSGSNDSLKQLIQEIAESLYRNGAAVDVPTSTSAVHKTAVPTNSGENGANRRDGLEMNAASTVPGSTAAPAPAAATLPPATAADAVSATSPAAAHAAPAPSAPAADPPDPKDW